MESVVSIDASNPPSHPIPHPIQRTLAWCWSNACAARSACALSTRLSTFPGTTAAGFEGGDEDGLAFLLLLAGDDVAAAGAAAAAARFLVATAAAGLAIG
jgi:hypothetical protein